MVAPMGSTIVDALCNVIAQHTPLVSYQTPMVTSSSGNNNVLYGSADLTAIPTENTIGCESSVTYLPLPPSAFVSQQSFLGFDGLQRG
ncbi:hypothetical protein L3X38_026017 [Prunus dulcis]|uniref:Uncharacterized protein n=1 Tax=Prunus dulcis TaxID=3755 RepID=A0AAD4W2Y5_PRUDU|nr:hypothetical protein L3X38_026017 [Prunus dulcis]